MKIALIGIQGSGKSTQATRVASALDIPAVSVGGILREGIVQGDPFITHHYTESDIAAGKMAPDSLIYQVVEQLLQKRSSFVIEGFPRSEVQAQFLLDHTELDAVVELTLSPEEAEHRLLDRGRDDDHHGAICKRFAAYETHIDSIRRIFRTAGVYHAVPSSGSVSAVTEKILCCVGKKPVAVY